MENFVRKSQMWGMTVVIYSERSSVFPGLTSEMTMKDLCFLQAMPGSLAHDKIVLKLNYHGHNADNLLILKPTIGNTRDDDSIVILPRATAG